MNENPYATPVHVSPSQFNPSQFPLADRLERFAGAVIDGISQALVGVCVIFPVSFLVVFLLGDGLLVSIVSQVLSLLLGLGVFFALNGYLLAHRGQTIGKWMLSLRIVDRDTDALVPLVPLFFKRYAWLWIISAIPVVGGPLCMLAAVIDGLLIFRSNRACFHDDLANTKVIRLPR